MSDVSCRAFSYFRVGEARGLLRVGVGESGMGVVVCDITMPDVTGIDVYEAAGANDSSLASRFIFICGGVFTERAQQFIDRVRPPIVWKPFNPPEIRQAVDRHLASVDVTTPS